MFFSSRETLAKRAEYIIMLNITLLRDCFLNFTILNIYRDVANLLEDDDIILYFILI